MYADKPTDEPAGIKRPRAGPPTPAARAGFREPGHRLQPWPRLRIPSRVLAFCGALGLQSMLAARKVRDPADNRTNLYILGLANSGAGKDYPRKVNQKILLEVGLAESLGDTFASGEGIEDRLFVNPQVLFQTDEIDGLMSKINLGKDARHEGIMNVLLKMYTSAPTRSIRCGSRRARSQAVIDQPGLCIFGTAIPKHFYEALSIKMLTNGFFARMLILGDRQTGPGPGRHCATPARGVVATAGWVGGIQARRAGREPEQLASHTATSVEHASSAKALLREFRQRADVEYSQAEERNDPVGMAIWARAHEKARRLALVYACSENHEQPQIASPPCVGPASSLITRPGACCSCRPRALARTNSTPAAKKLVATLRRCETGMATPGCRSGRSTASIRGASGSKRKCGPRCSIKGWSNTRSERPVAPPQKLYRLS